MIRVLEKYKPNSIIEWGTGISTVIMCIICPKVKIISIEHNFLWYIYWKWQLKYLKNLKIIYVKNIDKYVNITKNRYDMAFIDGIERKKCLDVAINLTNKVILIHDVNKYLNNLKINIEYNTGIIEIDNIKLRNIKKVNK